MENKTSKIINIGNGFTYEKDEFTRDSEDNDYMILLKHLGQCYSSLKYETEEERDSDFNRIDKILKGVYKDLIITR